MMTNSLTDPMFHSSEPEHSDAGVEIKIILNLFKPPHGAPLPPCGTDVQSDDNEASALPTGASDSIVEPDWDSIIQKLCDAVDCSKLDVPDEEDTDEDSLKFGGQK